MGFAALPGQPRLDAGNSSAWTCTTRILSIPTPNRSARSARARPTGSLVGGGVTVTVISRAGFVSAGDVTVSERVERLIGGKRGGVGLGSTTAGVSSPDSAAGTVLSPSGRQAAAAPMVIASPIRSMGICLHEIIARFLSGSGIETICGSVEFRRRFVGCSSTRPIVE